MKSLVYIPALVVLFALPGCEYNKGEVVDPAGGPVSFNADIKPIVLQHCAICHSQTPTDPDQPPSPILLFNTATNDFSGLHDMALTTYNADFTYLQARLRGLDAMKRMPYMRDPLPDSLLTKIDRWIKQGAPTDN